MNEKKWGIIILAAGASSRMGQPKQLLEYKGDTLIRRICKLALETGCKPVFSVLGANYEAIEKEISDLEVEKIINPDWPEGMSTSLKAAFRYIEEKTLILEGVLVLLVDQPHIQLSFLQEVLESASKNPGKIIATAYNNIYGVPAFFPARYFLALKSIKGDKGARKVLIQYKNEVIPFAFPGAALDIDTPEEWNSFLNNQK